MMGNLIYAQLSPPSYSVIIIIYYLLLVLINTTRREIQIHLIVYRWKRKVLLLRKKMKRKIDVITNSSGGKR